MQQDVEQIAGRRVDRAGFRIGPDHQEDIIGIPLIY
jgi:hypothetical protein